MAQGSGVPFRLRRRPTYEHADTFNQETLAGNKTLTVKDACYQLLDPGGSNRDVVLPEEGNNKGAWFWIQNRADAAENLVVKDDGAATVGTLNQNEAALFLCNGTAWVNTGILTADLS